jgi:hypothetical protein
MKGRQRGVRLRVGWELCVLTCCCFRNIYDLSRTSLALGLSLFSPQLVECVMLLHTHA